MHVTSEAIAQAGQLHTMLLQLCYHTLLQAAQGGRAHNTIHLDNQRAHMVLASVSHQLRGSRALEVTHQGYVLPPPNTRKALAR